MIVTRFAPSPTGKLHLGHAFAAVVARNLAYNSGGKYLLRFEDIDHTRTREEFYTAILEDLAWLEIEPDEPPIRQSNRTSLYRDALHQLRKLGVVYPCFCSRREVNEEISQIANAPHGPEGPLYPGTCRELTDQKAEELAVHRDPCWRLNSQVAAGFAGSLEFEDLKHGTIPVDPRLLGDVILARKDIGTSYHLAVVVDDAAQEITHVTRGEDLIPSTHVHCLLQKLLGFPRPAYLHHHLILNENGERLAKRDDSQTLESLRESGKTAAHIRSLLPDPWQAESGSTCPPIRLT